MRQIVTLQSNCIDIGAYRGGVLQEITRLAPKGTHFAFEPVPEQYDYLKKAFPHVHVHQLALSDEVIVFEHGLTSEYFFSKTSSEVYDLLTGECGLHISLMEEWLNCGPALNRQAFSDEVSVKKSFYFVAHP